MVDVAGGIGDAVGRITLDGLMSRVADDELARRSTRSPPTTLTEV